MRAPDSLIFSPRHAACLALLTPLIALAQAPDSMRDAANPDAPGAPLVHLGMTPMPLGNDAPSPNAWREAHDAVAAFPRGHADILAWEQQSAAKPPLAPTSAPPSTGSPPHSGHGAQPMQPHQHMPMQGSKP
ncbi:MULTISPECIES: hypothetical protein [unclassified Acidovorax]|uniref:hypothetical protein n=1 Tax=unclassified Acidovorax TaxID=2684926 RepID=UPI000B406FFF|nr:MULTISPECIES: hypothetical protein [unclassified Acidovorax]MBP3982280.1 hypothetical protein [Acidovorax sp. JG5]MBU4423487.1 hypothetical protein [Gammaproteobacteria bacterium]